MLRGRQRGLGGDRERGSQAQLQELGPPWCEVPSTLCPEDSGPQVPGQVQGPEGGQGHLWTPVFSPRLSRPTQSLLLTPPDVAGELLLFLPGEEVLRKEQAPDSCQKAIEKRRIPGAALETQPGAAWVSPAGERGEHRSDQFPNLLWTLQERSGFKWRRKPGPGPVASRLLDESTITAQSHSDHSNKNEPIACTLAVGANGAVSASMQMSDFSSVPP